MKGFLKL